MSRTLIMGILNLTPDSFSDGGRFSTTTEIDQQQAIAEAHRLQEQGADIIDVGGESTRPGAEPVTPEEEQHRILPVLRSLLEQNLSISVDTRHAATAQAALMLANEKGQKAEQLIINDVSGLLTDPEMPGIIAKHKASIVITHNRGDSKTMQDKVHYQDLIAEIISELGDIRDRYEAAGVHPNKIILDPGIGFAKTHEQNWEITQELNRFTASGNRILYGASRKGFLGPLVTDAHGNPRPAQDRDTLTAILTMVAANSGAWAVRVHNVQASKDAIAMAEHLKTRQGKS